VTDKPPAPHEHDRSVSNLVEVEEKDGRYQYSTISCSCGEVMSVKVVKVS
jgi:hypothetical protein